MFGEPQAEYAAIRSACGLMHRPELGVLEATGRDAIAFLNNLLTNALVDPATKTPLPPGHGCRSFFLNLKGRIVADPIVIRPTAEDRVLLVLDRHLAAMLATSLDAFRFAEKVRFLDLSSATTVFQLHGRTAVTLLDTILDAPLRWNASPDTLSHHGDLACGTGRANGLDVTVFRDDTCGVPGVSILLPRVNALSLWQDWTTRFGQTTDGRPYGDRPLRPIGWAMFNACRIEAGRPLLGVDFAGSPPSRPGQKADAAPAKGGTLPAETGPLFEEAVSVTGGCYLGQEVVARMHARKVVAKQIVGIRMDDDALPTAGAPVEVNDTQVGQVTSSTLSPILSGACLALATVKRPHFEVGTEVVIPAEGQHAKGRVVELPFWKNPQESGSSTT